MCPESACLFCMRDMSIAFLAAFLSFLYKQQRRPPIPSTSRHPIMTSSIHPTNDLDGKHTDQDVLVAGGSKKGRLGAGGKELPELYKCVDSPFLGHGLTVHAGLPVMKSRIDWHLCICWNNSRFVL